MLTDAAVGAVAAPTFEDQSAFTRGYAVALGMVIPHYTSAAAFPEKVFPPWDDLIWKKPDDNFRDLAALLAWRACLAAFSDLDKIFESGDIEAARQTLMGICGTVFESSDRADHLMRRYDAFERNVEARHEFFEQGYVLSEQYLPQMKHMEIHAWMINEALDGPQLSSYKLDPAHIFALKVYLAELEVQYVPMFKERGLDIMQKHIAAGKP